MLSVCFFGKRVRNRNLLRIMIFLACNSGMSFGYVCHCAYRYTYYHECLVHVESTVDKECRLCGNLWFVTVFYTEKALDTRTT